MNRIEKTVFISYRRNNFFVALSIYQYLTQHGYDVFFDYLSIASGDFEQVILENIKARAHFLVLLTPTALERCDNPGDWLRREIEMAIDMKRNIVPLHLEGFVFGTPSVTKQLSGKLNILQYYNALPVPEEYFNEAMARLCDKFLNLPLNAVLHPLSNAAKQAVKEQQAAASAAKVVENKVMQEQVIDFYSCFISYSSKDQAFAERLHADLQAKGVRCWFAPEDIQGGKKIHEQIDHAIRLHDKLLVVLSEHSMQSEWVKTEVYNARQQEAKEQRRKLFPISLVGYDTMRKWQAFDAGIGKDMASEVREYFIPDFTNWKDYDAYQKAFDRLLRDLKAGG